MLPKSQELWCPAQFPPAQFPPVAVFLAPPRKALHQLSILRNHLGLKFELKFRSHNKSSIYWSAVKSDPLAIFWRRRNFIVSFKCFPIYNLRGHVNDLSFLRRCILFRKGIRLLNVSRIISEHKGYHLSSRQNSEMNPNVKSNSLSAKWTSQCRNDSASN